MICPLRCLNGHNLLRASMLVSFYLNIKSIPQFQCCYIFLCHSCVLHVPRTFIDQICRAIERFLAEEMVFTIKKSGGTFNGFWNSTSKKWGTKKLSLDFEFRYLKILLHYGLTCRFISNFKKKSMIQVLLLHVYFSFSPSCLYKLAVYSPI